MLLCDECGLIFIIYIAHFAGEYPVSAFDGRNSMTYIPLINIAVLQLYFFLGSEQILSSLDTDL